MGKDILSSAVLLALLLIQSAERLTKDEKKKLHRNRLYMSSFLKCELFEVFYRCD